MAEAMGSPSVALVLFHDDPALACALIDKAVTLSIEKGKAFIKVGVDCIYIGDSYASGSVISPSIYRRFCAPAYAEVAQEFHNRGYSAISTAVGTTTHCWMTLLLRASTPWMASTRPAA